MLLILSQLILAQSKEMVITKADGSTSYIPISDIDNIAFISGAETGTVKDVDGNVYKTVKIGDQWWMAENLRVTHYRNGIPIPEESDQLDPGVGAYYYDETYSETYGCYYNWYAVSYGYAIAPDGWHVPTLEEWQELKDYLTNDGHSGTEGTALKSTSGWINDGNGTDDYDFNALPGNYSLSGGGFGNEDPVGEKCFFWSSTMSESDLPYCAQLTWDSSELDLRATDKSKHNGLSIRCVRD